MNNYIGENIRNLRRQKNVTQEELSEYLNISFQTISKWERGENLPDINMLIALANYFDVSTDELLGMDKHKSDFFSYVSGKHINELIQAEKYDEAINKYRKAQRIYPNNIGISAGLAMILALRNKESDWDEALSKVRQLTHIWEAREMITAELYAGEERDKYLRSLIHLIISLLYDKIENGQLNDMELLKTIYLGPQTPEDNQEVILKKLDRIKEFISK